MVETGDPGALRIGFVVFPGITQLDLTGPFEVLSRLATPPAIGAHSPVTQVACDLVAKTLAPVVSDRGMGILPTATFADCPEVDILCLPGGAGVVETLDDLVVQVVDDLFVGAFARRELEPVFDRATALMLARCR